MNKTRGDKTSVPLTIFHKCPIIDVFQGPKNVFLSQTTFTCSKSTMLTPEQCVKYVQSKQYRETGTTSLTSFWFLYCFYFEHISRIVLVFPLLTLS